MKNTHRILVLFLLLCCSDLLFPEEKFALVIGNGNYEHFGSLSNPIPEARELASTLESIGFEVDLVLDASREVMRDKLYELEHHFTQGQDGIAFFHYGGHAVQVNGENYLIPADADIPDERRVEDRALILSEVTNSLDASYSDTNIVILDACRNNPLPAASSRSASSRGLNVVQQLPDNSIVVFSASAGNEALDGIFTPILNEHLDEDREFTDILLDVKREVREATNNVQCPGSYDELISHVFLTGKSAADSRIASYSASPLVNFGRIVFHIDEEDMEVFVNGESRGLLENNTVEEIVPGTSRITLRSGDGFWEESVTIPEGQTVEINPELSYLGNLSYTIPSGMTGDIAVDGITREIIGTGKLSALPVGEYSLVIQGSDLYEDYQQRFSLTRGDSNSIVVNELDLSKTTPYLEELLQSLLSTIENMQEEEYNTLILSEVYRFLEESKGNPQLENLHARLNEEKASIRRVLYSPYLLAFEDAIGYVESRKIQMEASNSSAASIGTWTSIASGVVGIAAGGMFYLASVAHTDYENALSTSKIEAARNDVELYSTLTIGSGSAAAAGFVTGLLIGSNQQDTTVLTENLQSLQQVKQDFIQELERDEILSDEYIQHLCTTINSKAETDIINTESESNAIN